MKFQVYIHSYVIFHLSVIFHLYTLSYFTRMLYFSKCKETKPSPKGLDEAVARRLWLISEKWTELT